jgi:hypothetical protein
MSCDVHCVDAGAQYVKQYYMQRYGQQYRMLPQQYKRLQEPGAFRVVLAVRTPAATAAAAAAGAAQPSSSSSSSSSSGTAVEVNLSLLNPSAEQLAWSTRQVLNVGELLHWCNSWKPAAAGPGELEGVEISSSSSSSSSKRRYSHTVCIAHEFGRHGKVDIAPRASSSSNGGSSSSSSSSSSWWGRLQRRLFGDQLQQQQQQQQPWGDPELDPRALMMDLAVLDNAGWFPAAS